MEWDGLSANKRPVRNNSRFFPYDVSDDGLS